MDFRTPDIMSVLLQEPIPPDTYCYDAVLSYRPPTGDPINDKLNLDVQMKDHEAMTPTGIIVGISCLMPLDVCSKIVKGITERAMEEARRRGKTRIKCINCWVVVSVREPPIDGQPRVPFSCPDCTVDISTFYHKVITLLGPVYNPIVEVNFRCPDSKPLTNLGDVPAACPTYLAFGETSKTEYREVLVDKYGDVVDLGHGTLAKHVALIGPNFPGESLSLPIFGLFVEAVHKYRNPNALSLVKISGMMNAHLPLVPIQTRYENAWAAYDPPNKPRPMSRCFVFDDDCLAKTLSDLSKPATLKPYKSSNRFLCESQAILDVTKNTLLRRDEIHDKEIRERANNLTALSRVALMYTLNSETMSMATQMEENQGPVKAQDLAENHNANDTRTECPVLDLSGRSDWESELQNGYQLVANDKFRNQPTTTTAANAKGDAASMALAIVPVPTSGPGSDRNSDSDSSDSDSSSDFSSDSESESESTPIEMLHTISGAIQQVFTRIDGLIDDAVNSVCIASKAASAFRSNDDTTQPVDGHINTEDNHANTENNNANRSVTIPRTARGNANPASNDSNKSLVLRKEKFAAGAPDPFLTSALDDLAVKLPDDDEWVAVGDMADLSSNLSNQLLVWKTPGESDDTDNFMPDEPTAADQDFESESKATARGQDAADNETDVSAPVQDTTDAPKQSTTDANTTTSADDDVLRSKPKDASDCEAGNIDSSGSNARKRKVVDDDTSSKKFKTEEPTSRNRMDGETAEEKANTEDAVPKPPTKQPLSSAKKQKKLSREEVLRTNLRRGFASDPLWVNTTLKVSLHNKNLLVQKQLSKKAQAIERAMPKLVGVQLPDVSSHEKMRQLLMHTDITRPNNRAVLAFCLKHLFEYQVNRDGSISDVPDLITSELAADIANLWHRTWDDVTDLTARNSFVILRATLMVFMYTKDVEADAPHIIQALATSKAIDGPSPSLRHYMSGVKVRWNSRKDKFIGTAMEAFMLGGHRPCLPPLKHQLA